MNPNYRGQPANNRGRGRGRGGFHNQGFVSQQHQGGFQQPYAAAAPGWNQSFAPQPAPQHYGGGGGGGGGGRARGNRHTPPPQQHQQGYYAPAQAPQQAFGGGPPGGGGGGGGGIKKVQSVSFTGSMRVASPISSSAMWTQGNELYVGCEDGMLHVFDAATGLAKMETGDAYGLGPVSCLCTEPSGWLFAAGGSSAMGYGLVRVYKMSDSPPSIFSLVIDAAQRPFTHTGAVSSLCVMRNFVCSGGADGQIRVWQLDAQQWKLALELAQPVGPHHGAPVTCMAAAPDGQFLISASAAGDIKGWSGQNAVFHWPDAHLGGVGKLAVVANNAQQVLTNIVSCGLADNLIKVWSPAGAQQVITSSPKALACAICVVTLNPMAPPGLVIGFSNAGLQLVDLASMAKVGWLDGHTRSGVGAVVSVCVGQGLLFACTQIGDVNRFALASAW